MREFFEAIEKNFLMNDELLLTIAIIGVKSRSFFTGNYQ